MRPSQLFCSGLALAASFTVLGCGEKTFDSADAEKFVSKSITAQSGVRVKSVSCPDGQKPKKGATFTCKVTGTDGSTGDVIVTQRDDKGAVYAPSPFVPPRQVEAQLVQQLTKTFGGTITVTCPEIVVHKVDVKSTCVAKNATETKKVDVTQTDEQGNLHFEFEQ